MSECGEKLPAVPRQTVGAWVPKLYKEEGGAMKKRSPPGEKTKKEKSRGRGKDKNGKGTV